MGLIYEYALYIAWCICIRRIFVLQYTAHCKLLPIITNDQYLEFNFWIFFIHYVEVINSN